MQSRPELLFEVCVRADNDSLRTLSRTPLWLTIREFANSSHYWFLRVQYQARRGLHYHQDISWKEVWYTVQWLNERRFITPYCASASDLMNGLCLKTREYGNKDRSLYVACCSARAPTLVRELLKSPNVDAAERNDTFNYCCMWNIPEVVAVLLEDGRANPTIGDSKAFFHACMSHHTELVRLLLEDGRAEVELYWERFIGRMIDDGRHDILQLLVNDKRVKKKLYETEGVKLHWMLLVILFILCLM